MHRQFFTILSRNCDYIQTDCNNRRNPFHFACCHGIYVIIHKLCYSINILDNTFDVIANKKTNEFFVL